MTPDSDAVVEDEADQLDALMDPITSEDVVRLATYAVSLLSMVPKRVQVLAMSAAIEEGLDVSWKRSPWTEQETRDAFGRRQ
jgi:hypothetical protein